MTYTQSLLEFSLKQMPNVHFQIVILNQKWLVDVYTKFTQILYVIRLYRYIHWITLATQVLFTNFHNMVFEELSNSLDSPCVHIQWCSAFYHLSTDVCSAAILHIYTNVDIHNVISFVVSCANELLKHCLLSVFS